MVTGGQVSGAPVSRMVVYNTTGSEVLFHGFNTADLSLNTARMLHACGHYFKDDKVVIIFRDV